MKARLLAVAVAGFLSLLGQAAPPPAAAAPPPENLPAAVQQQLAGREALKAKSEEASAALRNWYSTSLDAIKKYAVGQGDLDSVLAIDQERDRAERDLTDAEKNGMPPVLRTTRDKYDQARAQIVAQQKAAIVASLQAYTVTLEALEKRLTQKGDIDGALAVRTERAQAAEQIKAPDAPPALVAVNPPAPAAPAPTPAPAPPGDAPAASTKGVSRENPGMVEVEGLVPVKLVEGPTASLQNWSSVPPELSGATIVQGPIPKDPAMYGVSLYKVVAPGRLYLALNYGNQGNTKGEWFKERWTEEDFAKHGWARVEGLELVSAKDGNRKFIIMTKVLEKDETGRIRCNKYEPPYFITFHP